MHNKNPNKPKKLEQFDKSSLSPELQTAYQYAKKVTFMLIKSPYMLFRIDRIPQYTIRYLVIFKLEAVFLCANGLGTHLFR